MIFKLLTLSNISFRPHLIRKVNYGKYIALFFFCIQRGIKWFLAKFVDNIVSFFKKRGGGTPYADFSFGRRGRHFMENYLGHQCQLKLVCNQSKIMKRESLRQLCIP